MKNGEENRLRKYMKVRKITQIKLAEEIGVTNDYISQIVRGRTPGMKTAKLLADYFMTTVDEIFFKN